MTSTVGHPLSYPTTSVELHNLKADSVYEVAVRCKGDDGKEEATSNEKSLHTTKSDAHPGVVNLHPTSPTSVAFHIVAPKASECDAEKYDVFVGRPGGSTSKTTVSQVDVTLSGLDPNTKYEVTVDAVCKGGSVSKKSAPAFVTTPVVPSPTPVVPSPTPQPNPPTQGLPPTVLEKAPTFHTITVFGPHPEVSVYLNGTVPPGTTVFVDVDCTNGFKSSVSAPASVPETTLHLATGLPPGTTCTYTAYTANGSKRSPTATEQRIVPSSALESPSLVSWTPDFTTRGGTVTVVAPQAVNCTGGIVEYTVTGTEVFGLTALTGRKRHLLQTTPAFTVTSSSPGPVNITNGVSYNSGPNTLDMKVVGKCADGSMTPSGHLSVNLASCPAIPNCATPDGAGGSCQCKTCASGFALSSTGYVCSPVRLPSLPPSPVPTGPPTFVEFRGDATVIATQEQVKVDFTFTMPCGSTFSESDPDGTTKCDWERVGSTDLSARAPGLAPGVYQYTVDGAVCPASKAGICDWSAYLYRDNPVTPTCKQTDGLPAGICRTAVDLKGACGSQCELKQGEKKTLSFTVNPDGSISFPAPSPVPTGPPTFVEFRGDGTVIATQEQEKVDFTFTMPCGSTFSESDPAGTTKCYWERIGSTDLSARAPGLAPGVYQYTVDGAVCPASKSGICDWSAYLYRDKPVTPTCKQTNGLPAGICRTAVNLKGACGSQCALKQGEKKTLSFTVNPDGSISFP